MPETLAAPAAEAELVRRHLQAILASPEFASSARLQGLLSFIVEETLAGRQEGIKETVVAGQVFHRGASFDPRIDSVVRVAARGLRDRLREYYENGGAGDALMIELPNGSYVPVFTKQRAKSAETGRGARNWWKIAVVVAGVAAITATAVFWAVPAWQRAATPSIAVLPFLSLSGSPETEYLTEGFVEELTTALAQMSGLQVVARSSSFQFRGKSPDIRAAGRQLGVETVLEGSLRTVGGKVRISAQLIKVADGFHLWSHTYEGETKDIFAIQDDLTSSIARALRLPARRQPAAVRSPRDTEAYDLYLKGQYFKDRVTAEDLFKSVRFLEQAVRKDPAYAPAHAALADAYATIAYHEVAPDRDVIAKAKAAAARALGLDGTQAEAHALLAWIRFFYDWDWKDAEPGLRRALELNPNSARTHDWYSQGLLAAGRFKEALAESKQALVLDPLSYRVSTNLCVILYCAHRYDDAIRQCRQAIEINPHYYQAHTLLGASLREKHKYAEAAAALGTSLKEYPGEPDAVAHLAVVQAALGRRDEPLKSIGELENPPRHQPKPYYQLAFLYSVLGDKSRAFDALEKAYRERASDMLFLSVDPAFDSLRGDPGFRALEKKLCWVK
jgi:TolB-like protein/Tfp pilus assembly protein PilF